MARRPRARLVMVGVAVVALLDGCTNETTVPGVPGVDGTSAPAPTPVAEPSAARAKPSPHAAATPSARSEEAGSDPSPAMEVPVADEPSVASLSELLEAVDTRPLVRAPLPGPASARGRVVQGFPGLLRPTRASRVRSSSISPSGGDRLQVGLVGSSSLTPTAVLLAFRSRLARRGLVEQAAPVTAAGTQAAAFRRGRSIVTLTVARQGSRTTYTLYASLHTGGA